jgi:cytosine/adenosine deaminase-related metal-dependent hydrolase
VDTHRHLWETALRNVAPDHTLVDYFRDILGKYAPQYTPANVRVSNELGALAAINAGITQILDWSHIQNTRSHTVEAILGLQASGIRYTFAYGTPMDGTDWWNPASTRRQHTDLIRSLVQSPFLLGPLGRLALAPRGPDWSAPETAVADFNAARDMGIPISVHLNGYAPVSRMSAHGFKFGPDVTLIHACHLTDWELDLVAQAGAHLSIAPQVECLMGHGYPPIEQARKHGVNVSLSVDVETTVPGDMFTQMRHLMAAQHARAVALDGKYDYLLRAKEVLSMATFGGALANGTALTTGSVTPGKAADLTILRADTLNVAPVNDPYGAVLMMDTSNVDTVLINGNVEKRNGHMSRNVLPLLASIKEHAAQIRAAADKGDRK